MVTSATISIKAVCTWRPEKDTKEDYRPAGFAIKSSNPKIETYRYTEWEKAYEEFQVWVTDFVKTLIPTGSPSIVYEDPIFGCKTENCRGHGDGFLLECDAEDLKISWKVFITHHKNRTLDEYEKGSAKSVMDLALPELQKLGEKNGFTVTRGTSGETA